MKFIESTHNNKVDKTELCKIEKFVKSFDIKWKTVKFSATKFESKYCDWLDENIEFYVSTSAFGAPRKEYMELCPKSKKKRLSDSLATLSTEEVSDTFKAMLKQEKQPLEAVKIADILPNASPRRLKRIVKSIPTPSSNTAFTEEEAIALMLQLGLSRDNYITLRKALLGKGVEVLPSYGSIQEKKKSIIPSPIEVTDRKARIGLSTLLENTALRIACDFSTEQLNKINTYDLQLICKWGCDGLSSLSEYKQTTSSQTSSEYKSVFMSSLVPLRIRKYAASDSPSTSFEDIWINSIPGSKAFCRPICFEYTKETKITTQDST